MLDTLLNSAKLRPISSIYIAGPIRGIPWYNADAFVAATEYWENIGLRVVNPLALDREAGLYVEDLPPDTDWSKEPPGFDLRACIDRDVKALSECSAIYLLRGWRDSVGARAEHALAVWLGLHVFVQDESKVAVGGSVDHDCDVNYVDADASILPEEAKSRKRFPMYSGLVKYFPNALALVSHVSWVGNEQHHPGTPVHWDKAKSSDEPDALMRHIAEGEWDKVAWRALANLERLLAKGWRPACWGEWIDCE